MTKTHTSDHPRLHDECIEYTETTPSRTPTARMWGPQIGHDSFQETLTMHTNTNKSASTNTFIAKSHTRATHTQAPTEDTGGLRLKFGAVATMTTVAVTACSGHNARVTFPSTPPSAARSSGSPRASTTAPRRTRDVVIAAYTEFLSAANRAIIAPPSQARTILQTYATGDFLEFQIRQVAVHQAAHEEPRGKAIVHVTRVKVDSPAATIHDCQDDSGAGLADRRTHRLIGRSRGTTNQSLIANMTIGGDGKWRVSGLRLLRSACHVS